MHFTSCEDPTNHSHRGANTSEDGRGPAVFQDSPAKSANANSIELVNNMGRKPPIIAWPWVQIHKPAEAQMLKEHDQVPLTFRVPAIIPNFGRQLRHMDQLIKVPGREIESVCCSDSLEYRSSHVVKVASSSGPGKVLGINARSCQQG